jgi:hypothetical protein
MARAPGAATGKPRGRSLPPSPTSRVHFDPVVKVEQQQGGGGGSQQNVPFHLAQPALAGLLGKYPSYAGPGALQPECACRRRFDAPHQGSTGPHARWDCPLRFIAQCGYCPGFTTNGLRLRSAWIDHDTKTPDTVAEWERFIEAKDLKPARPGCGGTEPGGARACLTGPTSGGGRHWQGLQGRPCRAGHGVAGCVA